jgi:hypothetical protein
LNTCSSSDPGLTGIVTPFVETHGLFFDDEDEPQFWEENFKVLKEKYFTEGLSKKQMKLIVQVIKEKEKQKKKLFRRIKKENSLIEDVVNIISSDENSEEYMRLFDINNNDDEIHELKINRKIFKRIKERV